MNEPKVCCLHQKEKFVSGLTKPVPKNTIEIVLKGKWLAYSTLTPERSREISWWLVRQGVVKPHLFKS